MGVLLSLFARWGVAESLRKPLAYLMAAVLIFALLWLLKGCYDDALIRDHDAAREAVAKGARDQAADQRAADTIANAKNEKDLHDAIDAAPRGGELSPAAHALACERLRKLGRIPAACRAEGGDGGEAGSR